MTLLRSYSISGGQVPGTHKVGSQRRAEVKERTSRITVPGSNNNEGTITGFGGTRRKGRSVN